MKEEGQLLSKEVVSAVIADKCRKSPKLVDDFRSDARQAFENMLAGAVPDNISINTVNNTPDMVHVALPYNTPAIKGDLNDDDLKNICGGEILGVLIFSIGVAAGAVGVAAGAGAIGWKLAKG